MAYDEDLAMRIRSAIGANPRVTEKKMFGGLAFLLDGRMFVGVSNSDRMMVRLSPDTYERALSQPHAEPMDFTGRPMVGYVYVGGAGCETVDAVRPWVEQAMAFVDSLPAKVPKPRRAGRGPRSM